MVHNWWVVLSPVLGLIVNVIFQILSFRLIASLTLLRSIFLGFGIGFCLVGTLEIQRYTQAFYPQTGDFLSILIVNEITYACLGYCYFSMIGLGETARRIRILKDLYANPKGLRLNEILVLYNAKDMVDMRIDRLINNGQAKLIKGNYFIGKSLMLFLTKLSIFTKILVLGKRSEFD